MVKKVTCGPAGHLLGALAVTEHSGVACFVFEMYLVGVMSLSSLYTLSLML